MITEEVYDTQSMHLIRRSEIEKAKHAKMFGLILGTLGRQGSTSILGEVENLLKKKGLKYFVLFLSEISADKLKKFP